MTTFKRIVRLLLPTEGVHMCSQRLPILKTEQPSQD